VDKRSCRRQFGEIFDFPFIRCYTPLAALCHWQNNT